MRLGDESSRDIIQRCIGDGTRSIANGREQAECSADPMLSEPPLDDLPSDSAAVVVLRRFLARVRRRSMILLSGQSLLHALLAGLAFGGLLAAICRPAELNWPLIGWTLMAVIVVLTMILTLRRAARSAAYTRVVDDRFDAAGRVIVAAEFLGSGKALDAFQKLALADTAKWIEQRPIGLPWTWPGKWPVAVMSVALAAISHAGCQRPNRPTATSTENPHGKLAVSPPDGGPASPTSRPWKSNSAAAGESAENPFGRLGARPDGVTYGSQPMAMDQRASSPAPASGAGAASSSGAAGNQQVVNPPGGSSAGLGGGPKQSDPRGVQAAKRDIEAMGKKAVGSPSPAGKGKPGMARKPGDEFAKGGPGATTKPAAEVGFDGVEIDEMTLERLPPEQRERIRRYNENLRKLREQHTAEGGGSNG